MNQEKKERMVAEQTFSGQTFSHVQEGTLYMNCVFKDTRWIDLSLQHVRFVNCHFENMFCISMHATDTHWDGCQMHHMEWQKVDIQQSSIMDSEVTNWQIEASQFIHIGLNNVMIINWYLVDCQLRHLTCMLCSVRCLSQVSCRASDVSWVDSKFEDVKLEGSNLQRIIAAQAEISGLSLVACTGSQVRIIQSQLSNSVYSNNQIEGAAWSHSILNNCQIEHCVFPLAGFDNASLSNVSFECVEMPFVQFHGATLETSQFKKVQAANASLRNANISNVTFTQTNLSRLDGRCASINFLYLYDVDCQYANLIGQNPQVWGAAQLHGAKFAEAKDFDDRAWWSTTRPGHRVVLS